MLISSRGFADAGLAIGALGGLARGVRSSCRPTDCIASVPFDTASCRALTETRSCLPRLARDLGRRHDGAAAPSDTPQQSNRPSGSAIIGAFSTCSSVIGFCRCAFGFFAPLAWLFTEMLRHRALQVRLVHLVLRAVGRWRAGRTRRAPTAFAHHMVERAAVALRQAAIARVLELLDAERQRDVGGARGHRVARAAERLGAAGAVVLDPRHRDVGQPQRDRQRDRRACRRSPIRAR
jgi:hypothetical protein